jgi:hypothetical protein
MEQEGGAFKVNSGIRFMHCPAPLVWPPQRRIPQCRNFSQVAKFAYLLHSLPVKHTFFSLKDYAVGPALPSADAIFSRKIRHLPWLCTVAWFLRFR